MSYLLQQNLGILQTADQVKIGYGRFKLLKLRESAQISAITQAALPLLVMMLHNDNKGPDPAAYMNSKYNTWKWGFQN